MNSNLACALRIIFLMASFGGMTSQRLYAMELSASDVRGSSDKKPVSVLQNRYFVKSLRPEFGVAVGSFLNEAFTDTTLYGVRGGLFFNEWIGMELQYLKANSKNSDDREALNQLKYRDFDNPSVLVSPDPDVNPVRGAMDVSGVLAPFYGKLNLFDKLIVYSDFYVSAGMARMDTLQGNLNAITIGAGQRFYVYDSMSFRIDFRDRTYTEQRGGRSSRRNALSIDLGASYFFL